MVTVYMVSHITHLSSARILNWLLATPGPIFIHLFIESLHDLATKQVMNSQGAKIPEGKHFYFSLVSQPTSSHAHKNNGHQLFASSCATRFAFQGPLGT